MLTPFHLAIPVNNLAAAAKFYGDVLACKKGRSDSHWIDWNFFGHQLVTHLVEAMPKSIMPNEVDSKACVFMAIITLALFLGLGTCLYVIVSTVRMRWKNKYDGESRLLSQVYHVTGITGLTMTPAQSVSEFMQTPPDLQSSSLPMMNEGANSHR